MDHISNQSESLEYNPFLTSNSIESLLKSVFRELTMKKHDISLFRRYKNVTLFLPLYENGPEMYGVLKT